MKKLTTIACALLLTSSALISSNVAYADSATTTAQIQLTKSLPAGAVPPGTILAAKQNFRGRMGANPVAFDPQSVSDGTSIVALTPIFDPLVREGENEKYMPGAAQSYSVSPDGLVWTFNLRKDATWQDGKPVTAADFVYSFQRLTDPKTASPYGNYLAVANVINAQDINDGKLPVDKLGVKAIDDYTLQITLATPTPWLPQMLAYQITAPVRKDLIEKYGDQWTQPGKLVGNGPYKLTAYRVNDEIQYKKWDGYWNAKNINITDASYTIMLNSDAAYIKYLSGDLDITTLPAPAKEKSIKERPDEVIIGPLKDSTYIDFNNQEVPYAIRRAVALLIDSKFLTAKISKSDIPTSIFVPNYIQDGEGTTEADYFNESMADRRAQAIKLLDDSGYTKDNPYVLTFLFQNTQANNLVSNAVRAWLQNATGGRIIYKTNPQEPKSYYQIAESKNYQVRYAYWGQDYDQASTFYNILNCKDPNNYSSWCNPKYDQIIRQANTTLDKAKRVALYQQANRILQTDLPIVPLTWVTQLQLRNPRLGGYNPVVWPLYIRDLYIIANKNIKK